MATVMTLAGAVGVAGAGQMLTIAQGYAGAAGNTPQQILYPADIFDVGSIPTGVAMLDAALDASTGNVDVLGHSMGSQVASEWLAIYGVSKAALAARVRFFLMGNPCRKYGHPIWPVNHLSRLTPDNTAFTVADIARRDDGWANWPRGDNIFNPNGYDIFKVGVALVGMFTAHLIYQVDLTNLNSTHITSTTVGNTTYHVMP